MKRLARIAVARDAGAAGGSAAAAHEMTMAEMELRETRARRVPVAVDRERQPAARPRS